MKQVFELSREEILNLIGSHVIQTKGTPGTTYDSNVRLRLKHGGLFGKDDLYALVSIEEVSPPPKHP